MRTENGDIAVDTVRVKYGLAYVYDAGGKRPSKTDNLTGRVTTNLYDIAEDGEHRSGRSAFWCC